MRPHRSIALLLIAFAIFGLAVACSSSSAKATPEFTKGVTVFFTPDGAKAPVVPTSFMNCVYGKVTPSDRTAMGKVTSSSTVSSMSDATGVRLTRAANQCDATLTNQLIEASVFAGAPSSISATEKTCATGKIISTLSSLDDSKLKGSNTSTVSSALSSAAKACGISGGS
jgi:hypothetical protein